MFYNVLTKLKGNYEGWYRNRTFTNWFKKFEPLLAGPKNENSIACFCEQCLKAIIQRGTAWLSNNICKASELTTVVGISLEYFNKFLSPINLSC